MRTSTEIRTALLNVGFEKVFVVDNDYVLPDEEYILKLGKRFSTMLFNAELHYKMDSFDCDDYALLAAVLARLDHAKYSENDNTSFSFGFATITTASGDSHACVCVIHKLNNELTVKLYEPQEQKDSTCLKEIPISGCQLHFCYM